MFTARFLALVLAVQAAQVCGDAGPVDMHTHTTLSDGSDHPMALLEAAHARGVRTLAVTDHDRVGPLPELEAAALARDMELIYGVEISCEFSFREGASRKAAKAHLLGHGVDPRNAALVEGMAAVQEARDSRNRAIVARMADMGVAVTLEDWLAESPDPTVLGRPHLAKLLVKQGAVADIPEAFAKYLSDEKLQLQEWGLPIQDAIALVHGAGGVATLAHPITLKLPPAELEEQLRWLQAETGLDGLEVWSSKQAPAQAAEFLAVAERLGLVPTGGSDYHGANKVGVPLAEFGGAANDAEWAGRAAATTRRLRLGGSGGDAGEEEEEEEEDEYTAADSFASLVAILVSYGIAIGVSLKGLQWLKVNGPAPLQAMAVAVLDGNPAAAEPDSTADELAVAKQVEASALPELPRPVRLVICFVGLQGSYLCWGVLQEMLMTQEYENGARFQHPQFLVFANRAGAAAVALVLCNVFPQPAHRAPWFKYSFTSLSNILSSWCQYEALRFLSFPTQVLSKSSKIIPVMIMGWFMHRKTYPSYEYVVAVFISIGVATFALASNKHEGDDQESSLAGVLLICMYLTCDSFTSQWQSGLFKEYKMSTAQMMLGTNVFSSLLTLSQMLASGSLLGALAYFGECPTAMLHVVTLAGTSAIGQQFIFYTLKNFGPLVFTIIMTVRMMASMIMSWLLFGHELTSGSAVGALLVFSAVGYRIYRKSQLA